MTEAPVQDRPDLHEPTHPRDLRSLGLSPSCSSERREARALYVRPPQRASVIFPLPAQASHLTGKILRPGCTGCSTRGKPVPLQATQVCSLILGVILSLSGRLSWAASFRAARRHLKETTPAKGDRLGRSFQFRRGGPAQNHNAFELHSFQSAKLSKNKCSRPSCFRLSSRQVGSPHRRHSNI